MKLPILFTLCLAALTLGFALGFSASPGGGEAARQQAVAAAVQEGKAPLEPGMMPASFGNDERIARVFSSLQQRVELLRKYELFEALEGLAAKDMAALVKHAESLSKSASAELLPALIERWFELDVAGASAWAKASELNYRVVQAWAKADPEGAFRFALEVKGTWSASLVSESLYALYGKDSAAKVARAQALPPGALRDSTLFQQLYNWSLQDPAAAFAAFEKAAFELNRDAMRDQMLQAAAQRDPAWALTKLGELLPMLKAGVLGNGLVGEIAATVARTDPRKALDWLSGLPENFRTAPAIRIGRDWARNEPMAALEWCVANGVDITRADWNTSSNWNPSVLGGIMEKAAPETFAYLAALPAGAQRDSLLEAAFMESLWHTPGKQLYADGDAMAWSFYKALPSDAQVAKAFLFGQKRALFGEIADVGAWAGQFAPGLARSNAIAGMMSGQRNAEQSDAQLAKLTAGADRDAALRGIATSQPAPAGADRALGIADETVRRDTLEKIVPRWLKSDETASRAWLQSAAIPAAWRQEWLK